MPDDGDRAAMAAQALAAAKADALARGVRPQRPSAPVPDGQQAPEAGEGPGLAGEFPQTSATPADGPTAGLAADRGPGGPDGGSGARRLPPRAAKRQRRDDPAPLQAAIDGLITDSGWGLAAATGSVFGRWSQIVGPDLAAHTTPDRLDDGELVVMADSTAWATQVRLLAAELVRRLNSELGTGTVRRVRVLGPAAASRRPGQWRVKGGRGPRDTYG